MRIFMQWVGIVLVLVAACLPVGATVQVASIFGDNMVLQRGRPAPVWGTAAPGEQIAVRFKGQTRRVTAGEDGKWRVTLDALAADSTPHELVIRGANTVTFTNVLVGEVWICSGQSNMEWPVYLAVNGSQETATARYPLIRLFTEGRNPSPVPQERCDGQWVACDPTSVSPFSAVGYFFARQLYVTLHVPIGMINNAWSGTAAEPWTSLATLKTLPLFSTQAAKAEAAQQDYLAHEASYTARRAAEEQDYQTRRRQWEQQVVARDAGYTAHWAEPAFTPTDWKSVSLPVTLTVNPLGSYLGSIWHRKTVNIPANWVGKPLELHLGAVDDTDDTFVNGAHVGRTWYDAQNYWEVNRVYPVPATLVTSSTVTIAVRVFNQFGATGLFGPASGMYLTPADGNDQPRVSLAGDWQYAPGMAITAAEIPQPHFTPIPGTEVYECCTLFNGMIHPLIPFALRGVIWYQGESNAGAPAAYSELFSGMITGWRAAWGEGDFPFAFVQLPNFMARQQAPIERGSWAEIREAQAQALRLPNTAMAVTTDIGEAALLHPLNKQDVAKRLALAMLATVYGKELAYSGPVYRAMKIEGPAIRVQFDFARGLMAKGDRPHGFAIAGADKVFHAAQARIAGNSVIVSSPAVPSPLAVRYNWANNPVGTLANAAGLPAAPFRTDNWPSNDIGIAVEKMPE